MKSKIARSYFILVCLLSVTAAVFARKETDISGKLLRAFKQSFPAAEQVKWQELADKYSVNFNDNGIVTRIDYDKDGNFQGSTRYYFEKNLPVNIICKLRKKYGDKKVSGVTEIISDENVDYYIKLEDATSWMTVKSNALGNMETVEKFKKAS